MLPPFLQDDETELLLCSIRFDDKSLTGRLHAPSDESWWSLKAVGVVSWEICERFTEGVRIVMESPLLWSFNFAVYCTYFRGRPQNKYWAACDLLASLPIGSNIEVTNPAALSELLEGGNGSLGRMPVPAIRKCQEILARHGIEVYSAGSDLSPTEVEYGLLKIGEKSYVIAEAFLAEQAEGE